jgi:sorbitol-6-phosphate 2-dehydrogenase
VAVTIDLAGRTALVTGGASGIGRGIALGLGRAGAAVAVADIAADAAEAAAAEIRAASGVEARAVAMDVTDADSVARGVAEACDALGGVDILVNCAGIAPAHPLPDFPEADWDRAVAINLKGYFLVTRAVAARMIEGGRGGSIVNISSKSGVRGSADNSAYNATKFGEIGLAQGWARELAAHNIRVNAVLPGNVLEGSGIWNEEYIRANARKLGIRPEEVRDHYNRQVPLGRSCTLEDVAGMVIFLCSDLAAYVTGCSHLVDGGQEMR